MKECFKCHEVLPLSEFYPHPRMLDGHLNKCKACAKRDVRERYEVKRCDPEWMDAERARGREKAARLYSSGMKWVAPEASKVVKMRAHNALTRAVKKGEIVKPSVCERCGRDNVRIEGHHDDYAKALDVRWLCPKCHRVFHYAAKSA